MIGYWWHCGRLAILKRIFRQIIWKQDLVIDMGCGDGKVMTYAEEFTGKVFGLDLQVPVLKNVIQADVRNLPFDIAAFDVILCLDVIEHIKDDRSFIKELYRILSQRGRILITVPAYNWLWTSRNNALGHYRRYSKSTLRRCIESAGFDIVFLTHFQTLLLPLVLIDLILDKFRKARTMETHWPRFSKPVNAILKWIFSFERHFVPAPGFPIGKSLICLARKRRKSMTEEEKKQISEGFHEKIKNQQDLDPKIAKIVNENFKDLLY